MKNLKHLFILGLSITLLNISAVNAQETDETQDAPSFNFSGTVDTYFRASFSEDPVAPGTSFANLNGFALGMANFIVSYEGEKSGFVADVVFGPRGTDAVFGSSGNSSELVNQLYAYYNLAEGVKITLGNFNTFLGYEVISPAANFNYSTSYMFSYGPFSHTGVKADFTLSDDISLMLGIFNQTDQTEANYDRYTAFGAQLGLYGQFINLLAGEDYFQLDYTGGFDLSETLYAGINAAYSKSKDADAGYQGFALYLQSTFSDTFSLGFRPEFFTYTSGAGDTNVSAFTLSANLSLTESLKIIPEVRIDSSKDLIIPGFPGDKTMTGATLAAIYSF
jgi:hypothetical protein